MRLFSNALSTNIFQHLVGLYYNTYTFVSHINICHLFVFDCTPNFFSFVILQDTTQILLRLRVVYKNSHYIMPSLGHTSDTKLPKLYLGLLLVLDLVGFFLHSIQCN